MFQRDRRKCNFWTSLWSGGGEILGLCSLLSAAQHHFCVIPLQLGDVELQWERKAALHLCLCSRKEQNKADSWGSKFHVIGKKSWSSCCLQTGWFGSSWTRWSHQCKVWEAERGFACWALKSSNPAISGCIDVSWGKECNTPVLTGLCHHMVSTLQRWIIIPWEQEIPRSECHWSCGNGIRL